MRGSTPPPIEHSKIRLTPKPIKKFGERRRWILEEDLKIYNLFYRGTKNYVLIPEGEIFDGASTPRWLIWLFNPVGILFLASIVHDYGYRHRYLWHCMNGEYIRDNHDFSRADWDRMFARIVIYNNLNIPGIIFLSRLAFIGVRVGGWVSWNKIKKVHKIS